MNEYPLCYTSLTIVQTVLNSIQLTKEDYPMGHAVSPEKEYRLLHKRYDRMVTGAPDSPYILKILSILYTPEEARLARQLPSRPMSLQHLSRRVNIPPDELDKKLTDMAIRGLVLDFNFREKRYFMLPPVVIGFFEFVFMRSRDNLPMKELAELFDAYMYEDDRFAKAVFGKQTQIGRALTHEESIPEEDFTEILDWERATRIIETASAVGVSMCACRHKKMHLGKACDAPMDVCFSLNQGAETLSRNGIARRITQSEALRILEESKQAGLVQTGDNVQRNMTYICNCCGCCCGMLNAIKTFSMPNAVVAAGWVMKVNEKNCRGCGKCVKACPIDAITLVDKKGAYEKPQKVAICDESLCLGCGVCYSYCPVDAIVMNRRTKRIVPPETTFDRIIQMAIERGKIAAVLFDEPETLGYKALGRFLSILERTPPVQALLAIEPLRSKFLELLIRNKKAFTS